MRFDGEWVIAFEMSETPLDDHGSPLLYWELSLADNVVESGWAKRNPNADFEILGAEPAVLTDGESERIYDWHPRTAAL